MKTATANPEALLGATETGSAIAAPRSALLLDSAVKEARSRAREFVEILDADEDADDIPGIELLPEFMERIAEVSDLACVPLPHIFGGGYGRISLAWLRKGRDNCHLYARLDTKEAEWKESNKGEHARAELLELKEPQDWLSFSRYLREACSE